MTHRHKLADGYYELVNGRVAVLVYRLHDRWIAQSQWDTNVYSPLCVTMWEAMDAGYTMIATQLERE